MCSLPLLLPLLFPLIHQVVVLCWGVVNPVGDKGNVSNMQENKKNIGHMVRQSMREKDEGNIIILQGQIKDIARQFAGAYVIPFLIILSHIDICLSYIFLLVYIHNILSSVSAPLLGKNKAAIHELLLSIRTQRKFSRMVEYSIECLKKLAVDETAADELVTEGVVNELAEAVALHPNNEKLQKAVRPGKEREGMRREWSQRKEGLAVMIQTFSSS